MTKQSDEELERLVRYYDRHTKLGVYVFLAVMALLVVAVVVCAVLSY